MQSEEFISQAVKVLTEIESQNEVLKGLKETLNDLKDTAKEQGLNVSSLITVAKAVVSDTVDQLISKSETTLEIIEQYRS